MTRDSRVVWGPKGQKYSTHAFVSVVLTYALSYLATAVSLALFTFPEPAVAQQRATDEIVVTVRRKEENLQEIPISVTAISVEQIRRQGVKNLADVSRLDSSVIFDSSFSPEDTRLTVRGLSNTQGRSNVAFLVDGVDTTSEAMNSNGSSLLVNRRLIRDVERIEIVKGPQSALYGRAAFGGAINYITKNANPDAFEVATAVDIAEYSQREVSGSVNMPINETMAFRLQGVYWEADGFYDNVVSGNDFGGGDGDGIAGTFNWNPTDNFSVKARLSATNDEYTPRPVARIDPDPTKPPIPQNAIDAGIVPEDDVFFPVSSFGDAKGKEVRSSENPLSNGGTLAQPGLDDFSGSEVDLVRGSLQIDWKIGPGVWTSITGFTDFDGSEQFDIDRQAQGRPDEILAGHIRNAIRSTDQLSQELRWASDFDGPVQVTFGGQYWHQERSSERAGAVLACLSLDLCPGGYQEVYIRNNPPFGRGFVDERAVLVTDPLDANFGLLLDPVTGATQDPDTGTIFNSGAGYGFSETTHWSVYGVMEWSINDSWTASVESRVVGENLEVERTIGTPCTLIIGLQDICLIRTGSELAGNVRSDFITPKFTLDWRVSDSTLLYASIAKGQKPGGITLLSSGQSDIDRLKFKEEKMWAYEIGGKTDWRWSESALVLNGAVFFQDYTDKQVNTQEFSDPDGGGPLPPTLSPVITNASSAEVWGLELQAVWETAISGLNISAGYTWLDASLDEFRDLTSSTARIAYAGECTVIPEVQGVPDSDPGRPPGDPDDDAICEVDLSGNKLDRAPEHSFTAQIDYTAPLFSTGLEWYGQVNGVYQSERFLSIDNFTEFEAFWTLDAAFGIQSDAWEVTAYVKNLTDDDTVKTGGSGPDFGQNIVDNGFAGFGVAQTFAVLPDPRVVGIRASYLFGD